MENLYICFSINRHNPLELKERKNVLFLISLQMEIFCWYALESFGTTCITEILLLFFSIVCIKAWGYGLFFFRCNICDWFFDFYLELLFILNFRRWFFVKWANAFISQEDIPTQHHPAQEESWILCSVPSFSLSVLIFL